jgi:hypothetical protein
VVPGWNTAAHVEHVIGKARNVMVIDTSSILRRAAQASIVAVLAGLAAACGSGGATAAGGHHHRHHAGAPSGGGSGVVLTASATPKCATSGLAVWLGVGAGGAAAGSTTYPLEFTNVSSASCHLFGYPGVSASSGHQIGKAAGRAPSGSEQTVTLAPGATAHALLQITDVANFPPSDCKPVTASGLQVYPPGQFSAAFVPFPVRACSSTAETFLSVSPVQAGVGVPGH